MRSSRNKNIKPTQYAGIQEVQNEDLEITDKDKQFVVEYFDEAASPQIKMIDLNKRFQRSKC
jgi:hypothetical protein